MRGNNKRRISKKIVRVCKYINEKEIILFILNLMTDHLQSFKNQEIKEDQEYIISLT